MPGIEFKTSAPAGSVGGPALIARNSVQFDKTNTVLANVPGLSLTLAVGTYAFGADFPITADNFGQAQIAISGTAVPSVIGYNVVSFGLNASVQVVDHETAMNTAISIGATDTAYFVQVRGTIVVGTAGTLTIQFAQNNAVGTSSVLIGGSLTATRI